MGLLSSFAINIAAGIVLNKFHSSNINVDKGIKLAFENATKDWSKNEIIRNKNLYKLEKERDLYLEDLLNKKAIKSTEEASLFITYFNKRLCEIQSAYNYLKEIKDENRYLEKINYLIELKEGQNIIGDNLSKLSKKLDSIDYKNIDLRKIKKLLEKVSQFSNISDKEIYIAKLYENYEIDEKEEKLLKIIINNQQKLVEYFNRKIKEAVKNGDSDYVFALKNLKEFIEKSDAKSIIKNYINYKQKRIKEQINLLKSSIEATRQMLAFNETINLYKELIKLQPTAENICDFAFYLQKLNYFDEAFENYKKALKIFRELAKENYRAYLPKVASALNNLANLHSTKDEFTQALEIYIEALEIRKELTKKNPRIFLPDVAQTLNNMANLYSRSNEFTQALEKYIEALEIWKELAKNNPKTFLPRIAGTLNNLANLQKTKYEFPQAMETYGKALKIRRNLAKKNPRIYSPDVAMTLYNMAHLHYTIKEYPQAMKKYKEALKIERELAKENPRTHFPYVALILNNLALLKKNKNEFTQAMKLYEEALKIYKEFSNENPRIYKSKMAMTLGNMATLHLVKNEFQQGVEKYEEALKIYRELSNENPRFYDIDYAKILISGIFYFKRDKKDLIEARVILQKYYNIPYAQKLINAIEYLENK